MSEVVFLVSLTLVGTSPNTLFIQSRLILAAAASHILHLKVRGWESPPPFSGRNCKGCGYGGKVGLSHCLPRGGTGRGQSPLRSGRTEGGRDKSRSGMPAGGLDGPTEMGQSDPSCFWDHHSSTHPFIHSLNHNRSYSTLNEWIHLPCPGRSGYNVSEMGRSGPSGGRGSAPFSGSPTSRL